MRSFLARLSNIIVILGLVCLGLSAIFLMIGHDPDSLVLNAQAEVTANYAYALFVIGWVLKAFTSKDSSSSHD